MKKTLKEKIEFKREAILGKNLYVNNSYLDANPSATHSALSILHNRHDIDIRDLLTLAGYKPGDRIKYTITIEPRDY